MKKLCYYAVAATMLLAACNESLNEATEVEKDSNESNVEQIFEDVSTKDVQFKKFAKILSEAVSQNKSVREFLKKKALEKIDNDYNIFYPIVKNEEIDGKSFEAILSEYADNGEEMKKIFDALPLLNIHIPELVKQVSEFDTEDDEIPVLYNYEMYCNGYVVDTLGVDEIPGFDVLVLTESTNIRKKTNLSKIAENSLFNGEYEYVSSIYNPMNVQNKISKNTEGHESHYKPYHDNDVYTSCIDPELIRVYNFTKNTPRSTRHAMYYNWRYLNDNRENMRYDVKDCIFRFKLNSTDFYSYEGTSHILSNNNSNSILEESTSHKKTEYTRGEVLKNIVGGLSIKIKFVYEASISNSTIYSNEIIMSVPMTKLFDFCINRDRRHPTTFRHTKYTYTLDKYDIKSKWVYPTELDEDARLSRWDILQDPIKKRITVILMNQNSGTTYTEEYSYKINRVKSRKLGFTLDGMDLTKTIKLGINGELSSSYTKEDNVKITYSKTAKDLELGSFEVDYFMDCPILSIYSNTVNFYDNGCGNLRVTILPVTASYYSRMMNKNI